MTSEEKKMFAELKETIRELRTANQEYKNDLSKQVETIKRNVEAITEPYSLEKSINQVIHDSVGKAISSSLDGYNSPIHKLVEAHVLKNSSKINVLLQEAFDESIDTDFKKYIKDAYAHKVARTIVSNIGSSVDKVIPGLKSNPLFNSKLTILVDQLVTEFRDQK